MSRLLLKEGWSTLGLLTLLSLSVIWAVQRAAWMPNLSMLPWIGVVGLLVALVLAKTRMPVFLAFPLGLLLGLAWITYVVSSLIGGDLTLSQKVVAEWRHIVNWFNAVWFGDVVNEELTLVFLLGLLIWCLTFISAWLTFRVHRIWPVLLINTVLLFSTVLYTLVNLTFFIFLFIAIACLLLVRFNLYRRESEWLAHGVAYTGRTRARLMRTGIVIVLIIGFVSWFLPWAPPRSALYNLLNQAGVPWQRAEQTWARIFYYAQTTTSGFNNFSQTMNLGGSVSLSDAVVMYVSANSGQYWRASTYDQYTGTGWATTDSDVLSLPKDDTSFQREPGPNRQLLVQAFRVVSPRGDLIFSAGEPMKVDVAARASVNATLLTKLPIADSNVVATLAPDLHTIAQTIRNKAMARAAAIAPSGGFKVSPFPDYTYVTTGIDAAGKYGYKYAPEPIMTELNTHFIPVDLHDPDFQDITELHAQGAGGGLLGYTVVSSISMARADDLRRAG
ncbi:MAG: DUF3488 domain-containing protein, partial [Chloroflexi bacterium]|nr:DUF3488 domain-containing protein [Chloroflexota bacterium]